MTYSEENRIRCISARESRGDVYICRVIEGKIGCRDVDINAVGADVARVAIARDTYIYFAIYSAVDGRLKLILELRNRLLRSQALCFSENNVNNYCVT